MKKSSNRGQVKLTEWLNTKRATVVLSSAAVFLVVLLIILVCLIPAKSGISNETVKPNATKPVTAIPQSEPTEEPTDPIPTAEVVQGEVKQEMLPHMANWYSKNADVIAYLYVPDTNIDNVVMYTPDDSTKYLYRNIEGRFRAGGELLLDVRCNIDPESPVLMIHGHNMMNGTKFKDLLNYSMNNYWKTHSKVYFTTLYEEREYEVFAAFFDQVYDVDSDVFKFYEFINPQTEEEYNEGIAYFKSISEFDSGITPEFGDRLLMLVTCEYSTPNGRFVVVAREVTGD